MEGLRDGVSYGKEKEIRRGGGEGEDFNRGMIIIIIIIIIISHSLLDMVLLNLVK